ncbi:MAG: hypothetical protein L6Q92_14940 [Phycisphaerae bacterium]|nr:hypothetical protein [Phycisphaerae bacterium]
MFRTDVQRPLVVGRGLRVTACLLLLALLPAGGMLCGSPFNVPVATDPTVAALLAPAPRLPMGFYDYFGTLKTPAEARQLVIDAGLDSSVPSNFERIGLVLIDEALVREGRDHFFRGFLGDPFTQNHILGLAPFGRTVFELALDSFNPLADPNGVVSFFRDAIMTALLRPKLATTNFQVLLTRPLRIGSKEFPAGTIIDTGADVAAGEAVPVGFENGNVSCAVCHAAVDPMTGQVVPGAPNLDLNLGLIIALSTNSAGVFLKLDQTALDPLDPKYPPTGRLILDSKDNLVRLPDPVAYERSVDDYLLTIPRGGFDAGPDGATSLTKTPDSFVFGEGGMAWDGGFRIGPFAGVAAFSNAVHSFEVNLLSPFRFSDITAGVDPEVYLGVVLQNASDPSIRIPDGVKPSQWLAQQAPGAERDRLLELSSFPSATLFSLNSLVFSEPGKKFMRTVNAAAAFQSSLAVPPNRTPENQAALASGAVIRGAEVFLAAGCNGCHPPPFFTNGQIVSNDVIKANPVRGKARLAVGPFLVESVIPSFDQMVPLPPIPNQLTIPPDPLTGSNLVLPPGLDTPAGGYKVTGLLGTYLKAPYLHDGGVAVGPDALQINPDGSFQIVNLDAVGVAGTLRRNGPVSAANSLRALLDRDLREAVVTLNGFDPNLTSLGIEGKGHEFWVDPGAGFTYQQQSDLIRFLLALDDNPGAF